MSERERERERAVHTTSWRSVMAPRLLQQRTRLRTVMGEAAESHPGSRNCSLRHLKKCSQSSRTSSVLLSQCRVMRTQLLMLMRSADSDGRASPCNKGSSSGKWTKLHNSHGKYSHILFPSIILSPEKKSSKVSRALVSESGLSAWRPQVLPCSGHMITFLVG